MNFREATEEEIRRVLTDDSIWPKITRGKSLNKDEFTLKPGVYMTLTGDEVLFLDEKDSIHPNFLPNVKGSFFFVVRRWVSLLLQFRPHVFAVVDDQDRNLIRFCELLGFDVVEKSGNKSLFVKSRF